MLLGYYASTTFIDELIGQLLDGLHKTGKADDTVIVLWGDHGFHLGDHGMWGKHSTLEQANKVPFIIVIPNGIKRVYDKPVELLDIYPTLIELARLPTEQQLHGDSLYSILTNEQAELNKVAISQYRRGQTMGYSLRTNQYRYTEYVTNQGDVKYRDLYDLNNDPLETTNLLKNGKNQKLANTLADILRDNREGLTWLK